MRTKKQVNTSYYLCRLVLSPQHEALLDALYGQKVTATDIMVGLVNFGASVMSLPFTMAEGVGDYLDTAVSGTYVNEYGITRDASVGRRIWAGTMAGLTVLPVGDIAEGGFQAIRGIGGAADFLSARVGEVGAFLDETVPILNPANYRYEPARLYSGLPLPEYVSPTAAEEAAWTVGPHGDMPSPRPSGYESHHGVNSIWMRENYSDYSASQAPGVLMPNDPSHNATRAVFNQFQAEIASRQGVSVRNIDWSQVSPGTAWRLAEEQFQAANAPQNVVEEYFRQFNSYLETVK